MLLIHALSIELGHELTSFSYFDTADRGREEEILYLSLLAATKYHVIFCTVN
jgi:hypothetical protein